MNSTVPSGEERKKEGVQQAGGAAHGCRHLADSTAAAAAAAASGKAAERSSNVAGFLFSCGEKPHQKWCLKAFASM
jgi:hypothetical protein